MREIEPTKLGKIVEGAATQLTGMLKKKKWYSLGKLSKVDRARNKLINQSLEALRTRMIGNRNFIMEIDGRPAGLLSMSVPPPDRPGSPGVRVHGIMAFPGTEGLEQRAIEHAVQVSRQQGRGGKVDLAVPNNFDSFDVLDAFDIYSKFGFRDDPGGRGKHLSSEAADAFMRQSNGTPPRFATKTNR